jgi:O-antigen/teichoic acid export membrane protein
MSSVKLKLPGTIFFASNFYSLFTGLAFTVMVTRSLTVNDFGLWSMISQYIAYTAIPLSSIASFWIVRYVARGFKQAPSSGVFFATILSFIGLPLYSAVALWASASFSQPLYFILLAIPQVVTYILLGALSSIATGISPEQIGVSSIIFETSKVALAYVLVRLLGRGLEGAIISVVLAQLIQMGYLLTIFRKLVGRQLIDRDLTKKWFKLSWLPLYELFSGIVGGLDVITARIISMTDALVGIRSVECIAGSFPRYASSLTLSLYPRILGTADNHAWSRDVEEMLRFISLIAIPITFGNIALMDIILGIFGKNYAPALAAAIVITIAQLIGLLGSITDPVLRGSERIDVQDYVNPKDYLRSTIFKLVTVNNFSAIAYVLAVATALMLWNNGDIYTAALYWNLASFTNIPFLAYKVKMMRNIGVKMKFPTGSIAKYIVSSALMLVFILILKNISGLYFPGNVIGLISQVLVLTILGALFYAALVLLMDSYARKVYKEAIRNLKLRHFKMKL